MQHKLFDVTSICRDSYLTYEPKKTVPVLMNTIVNYVTFKCN